MTFIAYLKLIGRTILEPNVLRRSIEEEYKIKQKAYEEEITCRCNKKLNETFKRDLTTLLSTLENTPEVGEPFSIVSVGSHDIINIIENFSTSPLLEPTQLPHSMHRVLPYRRNDINMDFTFTPKASIEQATSMMLETHGRKILKVLMDGDIIETRVTRNYNRSVQIRLTLPILTRR